MPPRTQTRTIEQRMARVCALENLTDGIEIVLAGQEYEIPLPIAEEMARQGWVEILRTAEASPEEMGAQ